MQRRISRWQTNTSTAPTATSARLWHRAPCRRAPRRSISARHPSTSCATSARPASSTRRSRSPAGRRAEEDRLLVRLGHLYPVRGRVRAFQQHPREHRPDLRHQCARPLRGQAPQGDGHHQALTFTGGRAEFASDKIILDTLTIAKNDSGNYVEAPTTLWTITSPRHGHHHQPEGRRAARRQPDGQLQRGGRL